MSQRKYYKLGGKASVFSDHTNGLKVTKNVPGSTLNPTSKITAEAVSNGHIQEINEDMFNTMLDKVTPKEKELALQEQGISEGDKSTEDSQIDNQANAQGTAMDVKEGEIRTGLMDRLEKLKITNSKKRDAANLSNDELSAFIDSNS